MSNPVKLEKIVFQAARATNVQEKGHGQLKLAVPWQTTVHHFSLCSSNQS